MLWVRTAVSIVVAGAMVVSIYRFATDAGEQHRRWAALASAIALALLMSIYYAQSLEVLFADLGNWMTRNDFAARRARDNLFYSASDWFDSYYRWWFRHLPSFLGDPDPLFRPTRAPVVVVTLIYVLRSGVYRIAHSNFGKVNLLASAYWVHISLWLVGLIFLKDVYGYGTAGVVIYLALTALLVLGGIGGVIADIGYGLLRVVRLIGKGLRVVWSWLAVGAVEAANLLRALRRNFRELYERIAAPIRSLGDRVESGMQSAEARARDRIAERDQQESTESD